MTATMHQDRRLVTFTLFAYNQEKFIREAVEGAFSQTYEPLEIILSDDCSSDRTYQIMQEMVATYDGPHEVRVRKNDMNLGLIAHINAVVEEINGEIVVLAAGDDISDARRTEIIARVFAADTRVMAAFSGTIDKVFDVKQDKRSSPVRRIPRTEIVYGAGGIGTGAAYAYHRNCFFWPGKISKAVSGEDRILPLRASLMGIVCAIDEPLVHYRPNDAGLSSKSKKRRLLSFQNQNHLSILYLELEKASEEDRINKLQYRLYRLLLQLRFFNYRMQEMENGTAYSPRQIAGSITHKAMRRICKLLRRNVKLDLAGDR